MDSIAQRVLETHGQLDSQRRVYLPMWQEIADRLQPDSSIFTRYYQPGGKRTQYMFDATAPLALSKYAAAMNSMITPRTQRWHGLTPRDPRLADNSEIIAYCDAVTNVLFDMRYSVEGNFDSQANECYMMNGAYGNGALFIDDKPGEHVRYRAIHLSELFYAENFVGHIDMVHRLFKYTLRQCMQRFGDNAPPRLKKLYDTKGCNQLEEFTFIHAVYPNEDYKKGAVGDKGLKYLSYYVCQDEEYTVKTGGGYRYMPYAVSRYLTIPGEVYARGPASLLLPDIKQVNEMEKTGLRQAQLATDPPILLPEDGALTGFNMQPGAMIYGGVSADGKPLAQPFKTDANFEIGAASLETKRKVIQDGFWVTLFQILVDNPQMTATEAMLRAQEKGQLLGPTMGRSQSEFCGTIIRAELEIASMAGILPPMPQALAAAGGLMEIEYTAPINRAMQAEEGVAINQFVQSYGEMIQIDPSVQGIIKGPESLRELARIQGVPIKLLRTPDEMQKILDQKAQANQAQQALAAAPVAAGAAKDFAQAQAMAGASPQQIAPVTLPTARAS